MATIASLAVKISADASGLHTTLGNVKKDIEKTVGRAGLNFSKGIVAGIAGLGVALTGLGGISVKAAADMGMTRVAFTQMLGSAEKAEVLIKDLQKFAAETPFEFEQVKGAAQKFLAFGFTAEQVIPILTSVGNAASGLGMGQDGIDRMTLALGQMAAKGKVSGEEMRQLAESGIPAWQMLADKMGVSIPEAMDQVSKSGVSAAVGLDAIVSGMDQKFSGMMAKQSQEIPGLWATLTDNAGMAAIALGESLSEGLNIKGFLQTLGAEVTEFTTVLQSSGLAEALRTFIPPEAEIAIYGIATALTIAAIPAVVSFGTSLSIQAVAGMRAFAGGLHLMALGVSKAIYELQFIKLLSVDAGTGLTGLSKVFAVSRAAALGLWSALGPIGVGLLAISAIAIYFATSGNTMSGVLTKMGVSSGALGEATRNLQGAWTSLKGALVQLIEPCSTIFNVLVQVAAVVGGILIHAIAWIINIVAAWTNVLVILWTKLYEIDSFIRNSVINAVYKMGSAFDEFTGGALTSIIEGVKEAVAWFMALISVMDEAAAKQNRIKSYEEQRDEEDYSNSLEWQEKNDPTYSTRYKKKPVDFSNFSGGGGGGSSGGGSKSKGPDLAKEALQTSKSIEDKWYELFSTRITMIDRWYKEELDTLDKSKSANANYARDVQRLEEITQEKKRAALLETEKQQRDSLDRIKEVMQGSDRAYDMSGMSAGQKVTAEIDYSYLDKIDEIKKKYQGLSDAYQQMTREDQATFTKALEERGIAHEVNGKGELLFTQQQHKEEVAAYTDYLNQKNQALIQNKALQADIEEAFSQNSLARLQELLTAENAMKLNNYEAEQEMMATYQEVALAAHATTAQLISGMYSTAFSSLSSGISDVLTGTKSASEAFKELGKNMIKTVADFVAKKIAGQLMLQAFGAASQKKEIAMASATGAAVASAWAKAAAMVSLATMGGNSVSAIAGMTAATGAAITMAAVPLASGGITTGPAFALIGEGQYDETVLPLNSRIIAPHIAKAMELVGDNTSQSGPTTATVQIYGDVGKESTIDEVQDAMMWALRDARGG